LEKNVSKPIYSLQKGLDIVCCFDHDHEVLSALEISERLKIPLSTTYRYLTVLVEKGFLARDFDSSKCTLGYGRAVKISTNTREPQGHHAMKDV